MSDVVSTPLDLVQFKDDNSYNQAEERKKMTQSQLMAASQDVASVQEQSILDKKAFHDLHI